MSSSVQAEGALTELSGGGAVSHSTGVEGSEIAITANEVDRAPVRDCANTLTSCHDVPWTTTTPVSGQGGNDEVVPPGDFMGHACAATTSRFGQRLHAGEDCKSFSMESGQFSDADEDAI